MKYREFDGDKWLDRPLELADATYRILPEDGFESAQRMAFARLGRKATVYKLRHADGSIHALKAFFQGFSQVEYIRISLSLQQFGELPGLSVCRRRVIEEPEALRLDEPGLVWSILMPWIEGVPWADVVENQRAFSKQVSLELAWRTADVLSRMELRGLAHADISSSNVLITNLDKTPAIELIDVEDMHRAGLDALPYVPDGSPGYAHPGNAGRGCRNAAGDRFAACVLLAEMLTWHDPKIRRVAADSSLFEQAELCTRTKKHGLVMRALRAHSKDLADLFEQGWLSEGLEDCPTLADWFSAMRDVLPSYQPTDVPAQAPTPRPIQAARPPGALGRPAPKPAAKAKPAAPPGQIAKPAPKPAAKAVDEQDSSLGVPEHASITFRPLFEPDHE